MAKYIEALDFPKEIKLDNAPVLFLAGGITGCPGWQKTMSDSLLESDKDNDYYIVNPRRKDWPDDPVEVTKQIKWEHDMLDLADCVSFWFPKETLCPITLFELGVQLGQRKNVIVGMHPEYARRQDLEIQIPLYNKYVPIVYSLEDLTRLTSRRMNSLFLYRQD
jgi:hypothetical protein